MKKVISINLLANETASGTPLKGNFGHMTRATVYLLVYPTTSPLSVSAM